MGVALYLADLLRLFTRELGCCLVYLLIERHSFWQFVNDQSVVTLILQFVLFGSVERLKLAVIDD